MSSKSSKRRLRRINTEEEPQPEKKIEEVVEIIEDIKTTTTTTTTATSDPITETPTTDKELQEKPSANGDEEAPELIPIEPIIEIDVQIDTELRENGTDVIVIDEEEPELQNTSVPSSNGDLDSSPAIVTDDFKLVLPDLEIDLEQTSRCSSRRSHGKTIAVGPEEEQQCTNEVRIHITRLQDPPEVVVTPPPESETKDTSISSDDESFETDKEFDSTNASVFVNYTLDGTNKDFTASTINESELSATSYAERYKDKSYGDTLRFLTGRRTLRSAHLPQRMYQSNIDLTSSSDHPDAAQRKYTPGAAGLKRKLNLNNTTDEFKRPRGEDADDVSSPGLFSYFTNSFRSSTIAARSEIPSSTPKLTAYSYQGSEVIKDEVSTHIGGAGLAVGGGKNEESFKKGEVEKKSWCTVM